MSKMYMVIKNSDCGDGSEPYMFKTRTDAIDYISQETAQHKRGVYLFNHHNIVVDRSNDAIDDYTLYLVRPDTLAIHTLVPTEEECTLLGIKKE